MPMPQAPNIIGAFERVSFPQFNIKGIRAKIDTGAYTGALHCTKVSVEQTSDGKVLHFAPFDRPDSEKITTNFYASHVKSSGGLRQKRYYINTEVVINDVSYPIRLTLADRSEMKWPVLIGRRFVRANNLLIDVNRKKRRV